MNTFDPNQFSNNCAPIHSDDSIFFNLILNSNYENTKENCLLFLRNYSKQILYTKRDIFRIIINELTLGEQTNLDIRKDETIYLIHQIIKKYSRNNIINALYDFISLNEGENENENNSINQEKNSNNTTTDITNDKSQNQERNQLKKDILKVKDITNKKDKKKKDKKESDKKENENNIENSGDGILDNDNNSDNDINSSKLHKFLEKKRKSASLKKVKKDKKAKKDQKEKKDNKKKEEKEEEKEGKDDKNGKKNKKGAKKEKEKEHKNEKDYEKENEKEEENKFSENEMEKKDENEEKEKEKLRIEIHDDTKKKKEKENSSIKKEIDDFEKEGEIKVKDKMNIKKEENILNEENEDVKFQRRSYKNRIRYISSVSPLKSFVSRSTRRIISPIEIIKLESGEELNYDSNITIFPMKNRKSKDKRKSANQLDILSYLNMNKSKDSKSLNEQEKQFGNHLIKDPKEEEFIYSYRIKKYQNFKKSNIILFECNNNKCHGRGEYDIERKIFRETEEHNVPAYFHNLAFAHYNVKQTLLMDDCLGYQLFKDNNNFIKDKKVIMLNNKQ